MDQPEYATSYQAASATPLQHRVALAFGRHDYSFSQKRAYFDAIAVVPEDELSGLTWETLPPEARAAIEAVEAEPLSSWEDPTEVPDDTKYLD